MDSDREASEQVRTSSLLGGLFTEGVIAFEARELLAADTLRAEEARDVARAVPKRVAEFATGRACARRALAELGVTGFALRVGADREPLWPEGLTGSITHTSGFCGVVVAEKTAALSLGVDRSVAMASVLFSAKEAFFKCQFPLTREWLNFGDVSAHVGRRNFRITPTRPLALEGLVAAPWMGRYAFEGPLVVSGVILPARLALSNSTVRRRRPGR